MKLFGPCRTYCLLVNDGRNVAKPRQHAKAAPETRASFCQSREDPNIRLSDPESLMALHDAVLEAIGPNPITRSRQSR